MRNSTHTLGLAPAAGWGLADFRKARRPVPAPGAGVAAAPGRERATDRRAPSAARLAGGRRSLGDALDFALFAVVLAAVGGLQIELLLLFA